MRPKGPFKNGYREVKLHSYRDFYKWITKLTTDTRAPHTGLVFRGQGVSKWKLEPTLDRELRKLGKVKHPDIRKQHLNQFKDAMRGRRGPNPVRDKDMEDDEWWALGQHQGLATPLLDWTTSPFAAAYFAYCEEKPQGKKPPPTGRRCVFALCQHWVKMTNEKLKKEMPPGKTLEFYTPRTDENPRLVSQAGLFTYAPDGVRVEDWIKKHSPGKGWNVRLYKFTFPESDREMALRSLNLMNINHLTLFPDSHGASNFCNIRLRIPHY